MALENNIITDIDEYLSNIPVGFAEKPYVELSELPGFKLEMIRDICYGKKS